MTGEGGGDAGCDLGGPGRETERRDSLKGGEWRRASFSGPESLRGKLEGCDALVHCAGGGKARGRASYYANNRDSTAALIDEVQRSQAGPSHFILVSSLAAVPTAASTPRFPQGPDLEGLNVNDPGSYVYINKSKNSFRPDPGINGKRILSHFDGA